jgi:hypothetical protein
MSDRKALIRLASTLPKGSEERRTLLALAQKHASPMDDVGVHEVEQMMIGEVEDAIDDVEMEYEGYATDVTTKPGRGFRFGSGTDAAVGGDTHTTLGSISGSGRWPSNAKLNAAMEKADADSYDYATEQWRKDNAAFIKENNLSEDQLNYNDLHDLDFGSEAESLSEYESEAKDDESISFRLGALYFDAENDKVGRGEHAMEVFARVDFDGHFLPRDIDTFSTNFTFSDLKEGEKKLKAALSQAVKSLS